jgi:hypothetical protein
MLQRSAALLSVLPPSALSQATKGALVFVLTQPSGSSGDALPAVARGQ